MEWQIPIQKVEIGNINIGSPWARENRREYALKPMAPLSYFGTHFRLPFLSLLFPPLPIVEYNPQTGKLVLDMSETSLACIKLNTFQETLQGAIVFHQHSWFRSDLSKEEVKAGFQPIFQNNCLHLHCPSSGPGLRTVPFYKEGEWKASFTAEDLAVGNRIRVAVKIHGISFLNKDNHEWSGRCRIQHRILGMIMQQGASEQKNTSSHMPPSASPEQ